MYILILPGQLILPLPTAAHFTISVKILFHESDIESKYAPFVHTNMSQCVPSESMVSSVETYYDSQMAKTAQKRRLNADRNRKSCLIQLTTANLPVVVAFFCPTNGITASVAPGRLLARQDNGRLYNNTTAVKWLVAGNVCVCIDNLVTVN